MKNPLSLRRLRRDERGAAAIEFAIVATTFFMLMFGAVEYGLFMYTKVAVEGIVQQAGRASSLDTLSKTGCPDRVCAVRKYVALKAQGLINPKSVTVTARVVNNGGPDTSKPADICLEDDNDPHPATCHKWLEGDETKGYNPLKNGSVGASGDLVEIRVTYLWKVLFPMFQSHFTNQSYTSTGDKKAKTTGVAVITSSTIVKNEPF